MAVFAVLSTAKSGRQGGLSGLRGGLLWFPCDRCAIVLSCGALHRLRLKCCESEIAVVLAAVVGALWLIGDEPRLIDGRWAGGNGSEADDGSSRSGGEMR